MGGRQTRSPKRSAASSRSTPQPEAYEFFVDECVSARNVAAALRDGGQIVHVQGTPDTFPTGTLDVEWLPVVGVRRWILITKDKRIRKRSLEFTAFVAAGMRAFVLTSGGLRGDEQGDVFQRALPAMLRLLRRQPSPFIARVTAHAAVELMYPRVRDDA